MTRRFPIIGSVVLILSAWMLTVCAADKQPKSASAYAEFLINPTGCRETFVLVDVSQTKSGTEINFVYYVLSTCEEGDFLFYHFITGNEFIRKQDFKIQGNSKKAVLDTVIPVFDDEGGTVFDMGIQVTWQATGPDKKGTRPAVASLSIDYPFDSPYINDEINPSVTASVSQTK